MRAILSRAVGSRKHVSAVAGRLFSSHAGISEFIRIGEESVLSVELEAPVRSDPSHWSQDQSNKHCRKVFLRSADCHQVKFLVEKVEYARREKRRQRRSDANVTNAQVKKGQ
jgi:hypothetical protein